MSAVPKIFAGSASLELGRKIAEAYGISLGSVKLNRFSDGEMQPSFEDSVRGDDVFIVQSTTPPADNILELLLMVDAAKRASARQIVAVIPYYGYARQDRKDKPRVSIGAKLIANLLTAAGVTRIMTMDLHADQIQGFFDVPVDHLFASTIFVPYIQSLGLENMVIAAPDIGGSKRANSYAKYLNCEMALCYKQRKVANEVESMTVIGDVAGKNVIMLDDMIDTGGTLTRAAEMMMERGALSVRALCTHPVLSGNALERIENSLLTEVVVTDTIPLSRPSPKIVVLSCAELFSNTIYKLLHDESISSQFIF
ncbi:MAG: ribose-phosphate pyrophosphokinase [Flavobacteriales bacterium]|nr:ribose-phosphate pyrophosphokinase [Flavobacteriales bacterium]MCX7767739.1 ribose-phosphate pyrophosphokinase [Flavobacteriales bacterium]MDW8409366.1 ribose-phosphate pyrophosphokinase [Flavobacteriales bacterium]